jgi:hypothetical protein
MDIFFNDPTDVPVPPDQVEIRKLTAEPNEAGSRVLLKFEITPFQERPNIEISMRNQDGKETASLSVVEAIENKMDFTLHIKERDPRGHYSLSMEVFYTDLSPFDQPEGLPFKEELEKSKKVVANAEIHFEIK